jgi:hypothetical protein
MTDISTPSVFSTVQLSIQENIKKEWAEVCQSKQQSTLFMGIDEFW